MDKISIIIPVYNVEPYIRKCLDSVINQTYKNLEIICVDDGSTDNSGKICDEYSKLDSRVRVIHNENRGVAIALNCGLDNFTGDYVGFVDPDDWVELNCYEEVYKVIKDNNVDFVCFGFYKDTIEECVEMRNLSFIKSEKLNSQEVLRYTFIRDRYLAFGAYYWNKLFKAKFFRHKDCGYYIRHNENMKVGSDVLFFTECILNSKNVIYHNKSYYHYFQRKSSLVHSKDIEKRKGSLSAYSNIIKLLKENNIDNDTINWVKRFYVYHASLLAEIALENDDIENLRLMQYEMSRYIKEYKEKNKDNLERIKRINYLVKK